MRSSILLRITTFHVAVALIVLALAVFGPFVGNAFVTLDDNYLIYANPAVQHFTWANIVHVFTSYDPQLYIPLTFLSFQLNAAFFGMNATSFHVINLLLHCGNVVLVLIIIRKLSDNLFVATVTAALFAIHPIQTEAVLWAASRKDLLSGFFFLLSTLAYLRYLEREPERKSLYWSIAFFTLGLLAKVSVIMLPVWLIGIDWMKARPLRRQMIIEKIPYGLLAVVFAVIAVVGKSRVLQSSGTLLNILLPAKSVVFYVQKIFWPVGLSVIYPYSGQSPVLMEFGVSLGLIVIALLILIALVIHGRHRLAAFALATYFVLLTPSFTTFWKNGFLYFASDRYVYLASIGIFVLIAIGIDFVRRKLGGYSFGDVSVFAVMILLCTALISISRSQSAVWTDTESLYRNVVALYPDSVMAQTNLGLELQHKKNLIEARQHYERAIGIDPHSVQAYFDLSSLDTEEGKTDEARQITLRIVDAFGKDQIHSPSDLAPFLWLVGKLDRIGRPDEAERLLKKLIELVPEYPEPKQMLQDRENNK